MASVTQRPVTTAHINHVLDVLTRQWEAIPEVISTWETWDELDRLDFVIERPLREIRLEQLQHWNDEGQLSAQQRQRFQDLVQLIQRHRVEVDRIVEE